MSMRITRSSIRQYIFGGVMSALVVTGMSMPFISSRNAEAIVDTSISDRAQDFNISGEITGAKKVTRATTVTSRIASAMQRSDVHVSIEIHDMNTDYTKSKVYQKVYEHQALSPEAKTYQFEYLPQLEGQYRAGVGIFTSDWQLIEWQDFAWYEVTPVTTAQQQYSATSAVSGGVMTGDPATITSRITALRETTDAIVDVEVYNQTGALVHQQKFAGEDFAAGENRSFTTTFTPTSAETYSVKIGVFSQGEEELYYWNNGTVQFVTAINPADTFHTLLKIDAGGSAEGWNADEGFIGGTVVTSSEPVATSGVTAAAHESIYQTNRQGREFSYRVTGLNPSVVYVARLHFNDATASAEGDNVFTVTANGIPTLVGYDIVAETGGNHKALVREISVTTDGSGVMQLDFAATRGSASIAGVEVLGYGTLE